MEVKRKVVYLHINRKSVQYFRLPGRSMPSETAMVLKTRDKLIEVARQLFARKGIENTTMNDIATASDKGRRTIYTYFKSKREIFNAVVESESEKLLRRLRVITGSDTSARTKLRDYISCRFDMIQDIVRSNGSLRAGFFRDVRKVERARKSIRAAESEMLCTILREGVAGGEFAIDDVERHAVVITHALQGLDVPFIRDALLERGLDKMLMKKYIGDIILQGIMSRE